ncbi:hypothetical protein ACSQ67_020617 [Phaseolus vulgaris]
MEVSSCLDLTKANAVTRGTETVKGLRQELLENPSTLRMMVSLLNSAGKKMTNLQIFMHPQDAKALQEKSAKKAVQAAGGNNADGGRGKISINN